MKNQKAYYHLVIWCILAIILSSCSSSFKFNAVVFNEYNERISDAEVEIAEPNTKTVYTGRTDKEGRIYIKGIKKDTVVVQISKTDYTDYRELTFLPEEYDVPQNITLSPAQTVLWGRVLEKDNDRGIEAANITGADVDFEINELTDSEGYFNIILYDYQEGIDIELMITKTGFDYENLWVKPQKNQKKLIADVYLKSLEIESGQEVPGSFEGVFDPGGSQGNIATNQMSGETTRFLSEYKSKSFSLQDFIDFMKKNNIDAVQAQDEFKVLIDDKIERAGAKYKVKKEKLQY